MQNTLKILMAMWVVLYAVVMGFGALIGSGATDFNGNPNTLFDHVMNYGTVGLSILQVILIGRIVRKDRLMLFVALVISANLPWAVSTIVYRDLGGLFVPGIYTLILGFLYGGLYLATNPDNKKDGERSPATKTSKPSPSKMS